MTLCKFNMGSLDTRMKLKLIKNSYKLNKTSGIREAVKIKDITYGYQEESIYEVFEFNLTFDIPRTNCLFGFINNTECLNYSKHFKKPELIPKFGEKRFIDNVNNFYGKIVIYKDAYATHTGEFAINNVTIRPPYDTGPDFIRVFDDGPVVFECEKACIFGHLFTANLGHYTHDYLAPLMLLPQDFLDDCVVIFARHQEKLTEEYMKIIGICQYIIIDELEWVHAKYLAVATEGRPHNCHFGVPIYLLYQKVKGYFHFDEIKPTQYVLMNRKPKRARRILNFKNITKAAQKRFPEVSFKIIPDPESTIQEYAKIFSSIKFLFTPTGSNCIKSLFMHRGTVIVIASGDMFDFSIVSFIASIDIKIVYFVNPFDHRYAFNCSIDMAIDAMKAGLYYSKNGKWPKPQKNVTFIDYIR
ncbi:hypothetical protein TVAG_107610 [Trichomonas vaginalis G3]|uniref:Glycosyltransferase 61 catalytic domain-containing protein n=1 Tax=Trichomonas vaginalis (strain ATCC PRA-98 / G3) TaxID=412133 RepID=A2F0Q7_TRIV3|nr:glycosyltransferase family [Trichomonas vaginalis G3]EAY01502.1 hypothetical protein TVAG_107610 [Trichomonas vaginalis G3]KAI5482193.1 glycosyltransferase family [Trichomonas vaginalis G3]|eukprot:XP_001314187.1 hypothetical protein [Trichomonas vaginalis G3]